MYHFRFRYCNGREKWKAEQTYWKLDFQIEFLEEMQRDKDNTPLTFS